MTPYVMTMFLLLVLLLTHTHAINMVADIGYFKVQ